MIQNLLLAGGDGRALRLEPLLRAKGYHVETWGLRAGEGGAEAARKADALLFPYPYAVKNGAVPALTNAELSPEGVLRAAKENALVLAGRGLESHVLAENARGSRLRLSLYERQEPFLQANADISAEAALYEAMGLTEETVAGQTALVTGYGRFGRALALRLLAMGAKVWAAARRERQRLTASADGMRVLPTDCVADIASELSLLLNTVPARIIPPQALERLPARCVLMELASAPGGFDPREAEAAGLRHVCLPALPARYAPQSAAKALADACEKLLTEGEA